MGLLDDAIREHLELKRQHGADPDEVARQENEALGETRKAEFAKPEGEAPEEAAPEAVEDELVAEAEAPPAPVVEEPESEPAAEAPEPFDVETIDEPPAEPEAAKPGYDEDPWLEEERDEVPAGESLEHPRTAEPEPAEGEGDGEDVLEETPDFLQETPEHDRLWFEQRPPRDFDWDK
jgi:hypothetical protein